MVELTDLPETSEKVIRQNARWYLGVLDDIPFLWRTWRAEPTAFNLAQLLRHVGNKVVEWPIAALVYPVMGYLGWYLAYYVSLGRTPACSTSRSRRRRCPSSSRSGWAAS